ncbi:hippurate hydrolase [Arcanobacterium wilhelmae]|uniref:Hippurate hydrolase n=1 Tax=Arcanobacterium wilhelmae TaxID=1803177 RepID=A0ABT9NCV1_9ACTO|nr:amidohydrolase [Arcanobacterium wilhelmae]MDP9801552.1 hippurate hydrolase [Arcanobacterium wilhelmae]WFN90879.1 amidohydrolase [Arcanobacterium wilhelmae]
MNAVVDAVAGRLDAFEDMYLDFHQHPELSMQEDRTRAAISSRLSELGYEILEIGGGIVGILVNGEGPTVLFRADIDGLPVRESDDKEYASRAQQVNRAGEHVPVMHACGHDFHITGGLGAAEFLAEHRDLWSGTYVALFQPGEETGEGAKVMVAAGLVDAVNAATGNGRVDVALAQHVLPAPVAGHVATVVGPVFSAAATLRITFTGRGSHGSMPHLGIDPVLMGAHTVTRLNEIVSRELAPGEFGVVSVNAFHAGEAANVIPDSSELLVNIRAYSDETYEKEIAAIHRIAQAEAAASGAPAPVVEMFEDTPVVTNDAVVTARVRESLVSVLGEERVDDLVPSTASEDFSIIADAFGAPYCYWGLGGFADPAAAQPNHSPHFVPDLHPTLETGVAAAIAGVLAYLGK